MLPFAGLMRRPAPPIAICALPPYTRGWRSAISRSKMVRFFLALGAAGWILAARSDAQIAPGRWNVARVRCSDPLGASAEDRAAAAMFCYGYLAVKAGIHIIDVSQIDGNVSRVMGQCAASPASRFSAGAPITLSILLTSLVPRFIPS